MKPALFAVSAAFAAWAGMAALCFQSPTQRHRMGFREQTRRQRWQFIIIGCGQLFLSLAAAITADGASFGIVLWLCQAGVLGLAMICCLPYSGIRVAAISRVAALTAPVLLAVGICL